MVIENGIGEGAVRTSTRQRKRPREYDYDAILLAEQKPVRSRTSVHTEKERKKGVSFVRSANAKRTQAQYDSSRSSKKRRDAKAKRQIVRDDNRLKNNLDFAQDELTGFMLDNNIRTAQNQFYATSGLALFPSSNALELLLDKQRWGNADEQRRASDVLQETIRLVNEEAITANDVHTILKEFNTVFKNPDLPMCGCCGIRNLFRNVVGMPAGTSRTKYNYTIANLDSAMLTPLRLSSEEEDEYMDLGSYRWACSVTAVKTEKGTININT